MILQTLNDYYVRKSSSGEMAPDGFEPKAIPFVLVLDEKGNFIQIDDTRTIDGKKKLARNFLVPQAVKRASGVSANLLWDTPEYVLGFTREGGKPERVVAQQAAFKARIDSLGPSDDVGLLAVRRFLDSLDLTLLMTDALWAELASENPFISFRLSEDAADTLICQRPMVIEKIRMADNTRSENQALCLVSGAEDDIARLHPSIKGVWGAQMAGANIVSFNLDAFSSFGKKQSYNAPVGEKAAFAYTTALNHLLRKGSPQRMQIGDASTVFWAADTSKSEFEDDFKSMFGESEKDDPDKGVEAVRNLYRATASGAYERNDSAARFFVLGLAPNAARISVRFWQVATVAELALRIRQHFDDLELIKPDFESPYLSLYRLFTSVALLNKAENIPPGMAGDTMRSILDGTPYPITLLQSAIRRIRADQAVKHPRAAAIKASLNRLIRNNRLSAKELTVSLDPENSEPAYCLGRLFATLERIQSIAQPGINATIRERYYGAASSAPASVFPILLKLKNHHLAKIDRPGQVVSFEKLLGQIFDGLQGMPSRLGLTEQGLFAIGYYHQQQDFFTPKPKSNSTSRSDSDNQGDTP